MCISSSKSISRYTSRMASKKSPPYSRTHPVVRHLKRVDPILHKKALPHFDEVLATSSHRRNYAALFASLAGSIVSQQLSVKAADTIWKRLEEKCKGRVVSSVRGRV